MNCKCDRAEKLSSGRFRFKVSTERPDCENEIIKISAWTKLGKFPVHVNHDKSRQVGTATVFIRDGALVADVEVTDPETKARVDSGELSMASVGFDRLESHREGDRIITTKAELREISLVPMGCNFDARREKKAASIPRSQALELVSKGVYSQIEQQAIAAICAETGVLDAEGLVAKSRTNPAFGQAVLGALGAARARAEELVSRIGAKL